MCEDQCLKDFMVTLTFTDSKEGSASDYVKILFFGMTLGSLIFAVHWLLEFIFCPQKGDKYEDPYKGADFSGITDKMGSIQEIEHDKELNKNAEIAKEDTQFGGKKAQAKARFGGKEASMEMISTQRASINDANESKSEKELNMESEEDGELNMESEEDGELNMESEEDEELKMESESDIKSKKKDKKKKKKDKKKKKEKKDKKSLAEEEMS